MGELRYSFTPEQQTQLKGILSKAIADGNGSKDFLDSITEKYAAKIGVKKKESTSAGLNVQTSPLSPQSIQESGQSVFSATPPQLPSRSPIFRSTEKQEAVKKALTPKQGFNLQAFKEAATKQPTAQAPTSGTTMPTEPAIPNASEIGAKNDYVLGRVEKNIASAKALNDVEAKFGKDILDINPRDYYTSTGLAKEAQTEEGKNVELKNAYASYNQLLNDDYQYYLDHIDALKPIVNSPTATQEQIDEYNKYVKRLNEIQERTKALPAELIRDQTGLFPDIAKREAENAAIGEKQEVKGLKPTDFLHLLAGPALPLEVGYSELTGKDTGGERAVRAISNTIFNKGGELIANLETLPKALSDAVEAKDWAKPIADMADVLGERGEALSSELKARHPEIEQKTEFQTQTQKLLNTTADIAKLVVLSKGLGAAGEGVGIPEAAAGKGAIFGATLATTHNDVYNGLNGMKMTEGEKQRYALGMSALTGLVFSAMPTLRNAVSGNLLKSEIDATIKENAAKIVSGEISPKQLAVQSILKVAAKTGRDIAESTIEQAVALPIAQNVSTKIYNKITGNNVPLMGNVNAEGVKEALLGNIIATGLFGAGNLVKDIKSPNTLREQAVIEAVKNPNFETEISKAASEGKINGEQASEAIKAVGNIKTLVNESGLSGTEADALASLQYKKMQSEKIAEGAKSEAVKAVALAQAKEYDNQIKAVVGGEKPEAVITEQPKTEENATQEKPVEESIQAEPENGNQSGQAPETSVSDKLRGEGESPKEEVSPSIFSDMEALSTSPLNKKAETIKLKEKYGEDNVKRAKEINKMFDDIVKSMQDKGEIKDINCD